MTSLEDKLTKAKKGLTFDSYILKEAPKFTKQEFNAEIDARLNIIKDFDNLHMGIQEEGERAEVLERVKKEAEILSLMCLRKYK